MKQKRLYSGQATLVITLVAALVMAWSWQSPVAAQAQGAAQPPTPAAAAAGDVWSVTGTAWRGEQKDIAAKGKFGALGLQAGRKAKEACKGRKPDLVLVFAFHFMTENDEQRQQIMDAVAESFDKSIVYGTCAGCPGDMGGERAMVGVLALGGIQQTGVNAVLEPGKEDAAYATMAEGLKSAYTAAAGKGRLVLILGESTKTAKGPAIVEAFQKTLGKDVPMFGYASPYWNHYFQGKWVQKGLTAILVTGNFTCGFAMADAGLTPEEIKKGEANEDENKIVESAAKVMSTALGEKKDDVAAVFVQTCVARGHSLKTRLEEPVIAQGAKGIPGGLISSWSYGHQIGHAATGEPAMATNCRIMVCVIRKGAPNPGK